MLVNLTFDGVVVTPAAPPFPLYAWLTDMDGGYGQGQAPFKL